MDVEGNGEEAKVHVDLVLAPVPEPLVLLVELHLTEDGLRLYRPLAPVHQALLAEQLLPRPLLVFSQMMVHAEDPVALLPFVAYAPERASPAVLRLVVRDVARVSVVVLSAVGALN